MTDSAPTTPRNKIKTTVKTAKNFFKRELLCQYPEYFLRILRILTKRILNVNLPANFGARVPHKIKLLMHAAEILINRKQKIPEHRDIVVSLNR